MVLTNLSTLYLETGQTARAEKLLDEATAIQRRQHPIPTKGGWPSFRTASRSFCISTGRQERPSDY